MMYVARTFPEPPELAIARQNPSGDYNLDSVLIQLMSDFSGRCYLCESQPQDINIEHLIPHGGQIGHRLMWSNLFLCCSRCNNIKGELVGVLDCTVDPDVETKLHYAVRRSFREEFEIRAMDTNDRSAVITAQLLNDIFNSQSTNKALSGNSLRRQIVSMMAKLFALINSYDEPNVSPADREKDLRAIKELLSVNSIFASFLRCAVRDERETLRKLRSDIADLVI